MRSVLSVFVIALGLLAFVLQAQAKPAATVKHARLKLTGPQVVKVKAGAPDALVPILLTPQQFSKVKAVFPSIVGKTARIKKAHLKPGNEVLLIVSGGKLVSWVPVQID